MQAIQGMINSQPINQDRYTIRSGHVVWKMIYDVMTEFQEVFLIIQINWTTLATHG